MRRNGNRIARLIVWPRKWFGTKSKRTKVILAGAFGLLMLVQLLYPSSLTLPFSKLGEKRAVVLTRDGVRRHLDSQYAAQTVEVRAESVTTTASLTDAGLRADADKALQHASDYPVWQRLIPLSIVVKPLFSNVQVGVLPEGNKHDQFVQKILVSCSLSPQDAQLAIEGTAVKLIAAKPGRACQEEQVKAALSLLTLSKDNKVAVPYETLSPKRSDEEIRPLYEQAKRISESAYTFKINGQNKELPKETVAGWIKFSEDAATGALQLSLDAEKITQFLLEQEKTVYIGPGTTTITVDNGVEISREEGQPGRGLDKNGAAKTINDVLLGDGEATIIEARLVTLPAKVRYNRNYENNQVGLDQLLQDLVNEKGNYGIALQELSGQRRISSAAGSKRYIAASTYKLYVAYAVLKRIETGQMTWNQQMYGSKNVEQCFDVMIINSDNDCAVALGKHVGWKNIEGMLRTTGLSNTHFYLPPSYDIFSTASDEALFLAKLERGELVSPGSKEKLISVMKRQVYRRGIPSGTDAMVADKVGFLYGLLHDASIIYSPKGTYVLVILTDNSSWAEIADTTRRIEALLNK